MKGLAVFIPCELHRKFKLLCVEKGLFVSKGVELLMSAAIKKKEFGRDLFDELSEYVKVENASKKYAIARMKLSPSDVREIRRRINSGETRRELAEHYNVSVTIIARAYNGEGYYGRM